MGKAANSLFLFTSFFHTFTHEKSSLSILNVIITFSLILKKKTNNINTGSKSFEVLWNAGSC